MRGERRRSADNRSVAFDGTAVLELRGEIDAVTAPRLRESVERARELGVPVVLDMELVTFMDSSGIAALIHASRVADGLPNPVQIYRPSDQVRRVLLITGLDEVFAPQP
jgi:anti-sigma B factor antagonist